MRCAVYNCNNNNDNGVNTVDKVIYHSFPKDPNLLKVWICFCKREDKFNSKTGRICSEHFLKDDYANYLQHVMGLANKIVLNKGAVPSVYKTCKADVLCTKKRLNRMSAKKSEESISTLLALTISHAAVDDEIADIPDVEIKPEILNLFPVENNDDIECISSTQIKLEADPLNSFNEGYYVIQCKCSVMVQRSDKSVQCNLFEEQIETKDISIENIEDNTNNIIDTNAFNDIDVTVDYDVDNTNNIIEIDTNEFNDNDVTVDYLNLTYSSLSESSEDEGKFEELFAKTEKIYEEPYTIIDGGYKCNKCDKILANRYKLLRHSVSHQEYSRLCYGCGKLYIHHNHIRTCPSLNKPKNNEENVKVSTEYKRKRSILEIRQCKECGKRIKSVLEGNDHQNIHKKIKPYHCFCGSKCRFFSNFITHLKQFKCPVEKCIIPEYASKNIDLWIDRESKMKKILENNKKKKYTNGCGKKKLLPDSKLNCTECGIEKFPNYRKYREHLEVKHLEKKFVCKDKRCGHKFATERRLREHVKNIHLIQHKCEKCNLVFSRNRFRWHNVTCSGLNIEKVTISNYKTTFRNQLFYCRICTEHEEYQKINKHFSKDYHKTLEEIWKQKYFIKEYKCTKCKDVAKRSIYDFFIHLEKTHKCCFIVQINDIFKSFENYQPFIFNVDIEDSNQTYIVIDGLRNALPK